MPPMLGPQALEAAALRRGHVAPRAPPPRQWQAAEAAAIYPGPSEYAARDAGQRVIERRALRDPGPQSEPRTVDWSAQLPGKFALAPGAHHPGHRDLDRADALAAAAKGRGVRQMAGLANPDQGRRQYCAHRAGIDPAIGMTADRGINRAMIETGGAAQAAQHVLEFATEQRAAAIVDEHDMGFLGAV